jgi:homogentisate phytyltransferase/homogentisate geranylgeranyltransferase
VTRHAARVRADAAEPGAAPPRAARAAERGAVAARAAALWRFTRPHTVIGTAASIAGLYVIAAAADPAFGVADRLGDLAWTLLAGFCVNVYIVGVNQLEDIEIDRVNKPFLPLAAGELTVAAARRIVAACAVVPVVLGLTQGALETVAVLAGLAVGTAYSVPPVRLKRFPVLAALSITLVRSLVVNLGVALHFTDPVPEAVWALTLFVLPFSFAIAILKDVPDAEGDRRFRIATFTLRLGAGRVLRIALAALTAAYLGMAVAGPLVLESCQPVVLAATHLAALAWLWAMSREARDGDFTRFYMGVWRLFFLEYALVPLAVVLA